MRFLLLTVVPIVAAGLATALATSASLQPSAAGGLRVASVITTLVLAVLLVVKAVIEHRRERSMRQVWFDALRDLRSRLAPALNRITELALSEGGSAPAQQVRDAVLRDIAYQCAGALVAMIGDDPKEARASVFRLLAAPQRIEPIGWAGRADAPRTFVTSEPAGAEVLSYLQGDRLEAELYEDIRRTAPREYGGDTGRYRTFIRIPLWSTTGVVFGMLTLDAPREKSLTRDHRVLVELIAAELEPAFAIVSVR